MSGVGCGTAQLAHFGFWPKRADVQRFFMGNLSLSGKAMEAYRLRGWRLTRVNRTRAVADAVVAERKRGRCIGPWDSHGPASVGHATRHPFAPSSVPNRHHVPILNRRPFSFSSCRSRTISLSSKTVSSLSPRGGRSESINVMIG